MYFLVMVFSGFQLLGSGSLYYFLHNSSHFPATFDVRSIVNYSQERILIEKPPPFHNASIIFVSTGKGSEGESRSGIGLERENLDKALKHTSYAVFKVKVAWNKVPDLQLILLNLVKKAYQVKDDRIQNFFKQDTWSTIDIILDFFLQSFNTLIGRVEEKVGETQGSVIMSNGVPWIKEDIRKSQFNTQYLIIIATIDLPLDLSTVTYNFMREKRSFDKPTFLGGGMFFLVVLAVIGAMIVFSCYFLGDTCCTVKEATQFVV